VEGVLVFADNKAGPKPDLNAHLVGIVIRDTKTPISYNVRLKDSAEESAAAFLYSPKSIFIEYCQKITCLAETAAIELKQ
jgi:hypothetical protein